ncbi:MAG: hypothetical protein ACP5NK_04880 [Thermoplasmata archaeon]
MNDVSIPIYGHQTSGYPSVYSVKNNTSLEQMFVTYGNNGNGTSWTGADGTYSLHLDNSDTVWIFDDTLLGSVFPNGTRYPVPETPLVHNSMILERNGDIIKTLVNDSNGELSGYLEPGNSSDWFWPGDAILNGNQIELLMGEYTTNGSNMLSVKFLGNFLAVLNSSSLRVENVYNLQKSNIIWTEWLLYHNGKTYIFGTRYNSTLAYVASVNGTNLSGNWSYYDGSGWTQNYSQISPFFTSVTNGYSVATVGKYFAIITTDASSPLAVFDGKIFAYFSLNITGPYNNSELLYTTPEQEIYSNTTEYGVWTYGPHVQAEIGNSTLVISYNVDGFGPGAITNVSVYRPRFIDVSFSL